jgi:hypothetical protein
MKKYQFKKIGFIMNFSCVYTMNFYFFHPSVLSPSYLLLKNTNFKENLQWRLTWEGIVIFTRERSLECGPVSHLPKHQNCAVKILRMVRTPVSQAPPPHPPVGCHSTEEIKKAADPVSGLFYFMEMPKGSLFHIDHTTELAKYGVNWVLWNSTP